MRWHCSRAACALFTFFCFSFDSSLVIAQEKTSVVQIEAKSLIPKLDPFRKPAPPSVQDARIVEYVENMLRDQDKNKDGFLDDVEWKEGRWSTPPEESDTDKDGRLSKDELQMRIARRFGLTVAQVDDKPTPKPAANKRQVIEFELLIVERPVTDSAAEQKLPTAAEVLSLAKQGKLGSAQRLKLTALENTETKLQLGEQAPLVTSRTVRGGGGFNTAPSESVTYTEIGTAATITAQVEADGKVLVNIHLHRTSLAPTKPAEKGEGVEAAATSYQRKLVTTISATTRIANGEPALLCGQQSSGGASVGELWVVVTAKVQ